MNLGYCPILNHDKFPSEIHSSYRVLCCFHWWAQVRRLFSLLLWLIVLSEEVNQFRSLEAINKYLLLTVCVILLWPKGIFQKNYNFFLNYDWHYLKETSETLRHQNRKRDWNYHSYSYIWCTFCNHIWPGKRYIPSSFPFGRIRMPYSIGFSHWNNANFKFLTRIKIIIDVIG